MKYYHLVACILADSPLSMVFCRVVVDILAQEKHIVLGFSTNFI